MKTTVERESPTKLRLVIEVGPEELAPLYEKTLRRLANEVKVPGFRKGKVPRAVLESRVGKDTVRQEVLRDALPALYARAASDESVRAITLPDIDVTSFEEGEPLTFTATVEVRPEVVLAPYRGIEVERPDATAGDEEVDEQVERLRNRFGTLEPVGRNAASGDYVVIDLTGYRHDQKIDEVSAEDLLYEVGSESIVPELDRELTGKRVGDILKFNAALPERIGPPHGGQEISFSVVVKEVQAKRLPVLDDEFARTASEFDTLEELRADLRRRIEAIKAIEADVEVRNHILDDLVDRTDLQVPESMVAADVQHRLAGLIRDLQRAGSTLEQYLGVQGASEEQLVDAYRKAAERSIAADLILEAVARAEGVEVSDEEVDSAVSGLAGRLQRGPEELRKELEESNRVVVLRGDILRRKALDQLVQHAKISGGEGEGGDEGGGAADGNLP